MGITIHYRFARRGTPEDLLKIVEALALQFGMKVTHRSYNHLVIHPHAGCETVDLHWHKWKTIKREFETSKDDSRFWYEHETCKVFAEELSDDHWICSSFCKTQYAGLEGHFLTAELLRFVASHCALARIADEAGYYETGGEAGIKIAAEAFDQSNAALATIGEMLRKTFGADKVISGADLAAMRETRAEDAK